MFKSVLPEVSATIRSATTMESCHGIVHMSLLTQCYKAASVLGSIRNTSGYARYM